MLVWAFDEFNYFFPITEILVQILPDHFLIASILQYTLASGCFQYLEKNSMRDLMLQLLQNQSKIWNLVGSLSAIIGLVCFALSSTFKKLFGRWDFLHFLIYLLVCSVILCITLYARRIQVSENFLLKGHVIFSIFGVTCVYSVLHDKTESGKPDALSTISYGSFALMSLSMTRKFELGFETGLFSFFLECFTVQLMKISWILSLVALGFCYVVLNFNSYAGTQLEIGTIGPGDYHSIEVDPANGTEIEIHNGDINGQTQHSPRIDDVSVSGEGVLSGDNQQNNEGEETRSSSLSFEAEPSNEEDSVSSGNLETIENSWMQSSSPEPAELISPFLTGKSLSRRRRRKRNEIQNETSSYALVPTRNRFDLLEEPSDQEDDVSSDNSTVTIENGLMQSSPESESVSRTSPQSPRRRRGRIGMEARITSKSNNKLHYPSEYYMCKQIINASREKQIIVFILYDRTLLPIVDDPDRAFMSDEMRKTVRNLARYFPTAIVSERCGEKVHFEAACSFEFPYTLAPSPFFHLYNLVRLAQLYYAGSHGMDIKGPTKISEYNKESKAVVFQPACEFLPVIDKVYQLLVEKTSTIPGTKVENNKFYVSIHFRRVNEKVDEKNWIELASQIISVLKEYPKLRLTHGRKVLEIRPLIKWDKGEALEFLLESLGFSNWTNVFPVYIGRDRSDEDAFKKIRERGQGFGILVSKFPRKSSANFSFQESFEVMYFLQTLVELKKFPSDECAELAVEDIYN